MVLQGQVWKDGQYWLVEVPFLDVMSQGYSRKEALLMIQDAVESLIDNRKFKVEVQLYEKDQFMLRANDQTELISLVLKQNRHKHGLSLEAMRQRLGVASKNSYAQYEQGKKKPTLDQLEKFLRAMDPNSEFALGMIRNESQAA